VAAAPSGTPDEWNDLVAALQLQGPVRQLAAHCVFVGAGQEVVRLRLDPAGNHFRRPQLEQKLAQALSSHYGRPVRLDIVVSDAPEPTPARQQQAASDERLRAAQLAIDTDPAVRAMRDVFGATVQPGSVKPLE
jgi:DNA polymerase-3 subunit gamma/tau